MGCFNTVKFQCPECMKPIEVQTKGGSCEMKTVRSTNVTLGDASYIMGDTVECRECHESFKIFGPKRVALQLVPVKELEEDEENW